VAIFQANALAAMDLTAQQMGITGVSAVLVVERKTFGQKPLLPQFGITGRFERQPDPVGRQDPDDKGTNYLSVVWAKIAEMFATLQDSGTTDRIPRVGEYGYRGGKVVVTNDYVYFTAFSGAKPEQDYAVAEAGMTVLVPS